MAPNETCPFCGGKIQPKERETYVETARAELARILTQLRGLEESDNDIDSRLKEIRMEIRPLEERIEEINTMIAAELNPHAEKLKEAISQYRSYIQLQGEISLLHTLSTDWSTCLLYTSRCV